jgi:hypothetical protein
MENNLRQRAASKSPYDGVKSKINNRSVTVGKYDSKKKTELYI